MQHQRKAYNTSAKHEAHPLTHQMARSLGIATVTVTEAVMLPLYTVDHLEAAAA
jgi:hypothetical protein